MSIPVIRAGLIATASLFYLALATPQALASVEQFNQALAGEYQALAKVEKLSGDHRDADAYTLRAEAARGGNPTDPEQSALRLPFLKGHYLSDLDAARTRLMAAFEKNARDIASSPAAKAQSSYDCWLEQAAEDLQPAHIQACKDAYMVAIAAVEKALIPAPAPPAVDGDSDGDGVPDSRDDCPNTPSGTPVDERGCPEIPNLEGVHFKHDSSKLTDEARRILDSVVNIVESNPHVQLEIVGHTDSTGSDAYNAGLSERRADSVKSYLAERGVDRRLMATEGRGESSPIADNTTREGRATNRRVEIVARPQ